MKRCDVSHYCALPSMASSLGHMKNGHSMRKGPSAGSCAHLVPIGQHSFESPQCVKLVAKVYIIDVVLQIVCMRLTASESFYFIF